jgi:dTDP-4-dehydrorhamnose reductase
MKKKVMISGAGGLLGKAAAEHFRKEYDVLALDRHQLDITDTATVRRLATEFSPDLILNCAAAARVDACESDREHAWAVNATGPGILASIASQIGAEIMHISTDYIFDGSKREPYTIEDKAEPLSAYGQSKLDGESAVTAATDRFYIARVARLFGKSGTNFGSRIFHHLKQASDNASKMKVFSYPLSQATYLPDLAERLSEIAAKGEYGIYHLTNSGPVVSWYEFALFAAQMMGLGEELIETVEYEELGLPAKRPYYSALRCLVSERLGMEAMRDWREGLSQMYEQWKSDCR